MKLYQIIRDTEGYEEHTTDLTFEEANETLAELEKFFPEEQYSIHPQLKKTKEKEYRNIPHGQVDGWEDLYN